MGVKPTTAKAAVGFTSKHPVLYRGTLERMKALMP